MIEQNNKKQEDDRFNKVATSFGYISSVWAGWYAFVRSVKDQMFGTLREIGELPQFDEHIENFKKIEKLGKTGHTSEQIRDEFQNKWTVFYENFKKQNNLEALSSKWNVLHRSQKVEAVGIGFTVATVVLGAVLTVANSKNIFHNDEKTR